METDQKEVEELMDYDNEQFVQEEVRNHFMCDKYIYSMIWPKT